jgi:O-acetylserine/cysteine efflux transporter
MNPGTHYFLLIILRRCYNVTYFVMVIIMKRFTFQLSDWLMLLVIQIWALNLSLVKLALKEIHPIPYNGIRLLFGSLFLIVWLLKTEGNLHIQKEHILKIIFLSITGYTVYQYCFITGITYTTVSNTAVIFGISPIMISLFSIFFKHEKIKPIAWLGILLGFIGVYITITGKSGKFDFNVKTLKGDLLILLAVILWAHYTVSARPLLKHYSPLKFTTITMSLGSILFFPFSLVQIVQMDYSAVSIKSWVFLAYSGAFGLGIGLIMWFYSIKKVGSSQTAVYSNIQPIFSILFAWAILSETIPPALLLGTAVILVGVFFTHLGRQPVIR